MENIFHRIPYRESYEDYFHWNFQYSLNSTRIILHKRLLIQTLQHCHYAATRKSLLLHKYNNIQTYIKKGREYLSASH